MHCPPEIAQVVQEILRIGILRIRSYGSHHDAVRCAIEADHLHNLPALLADYRPELLDFYLQVERVDFARRSSADDIECFQQLWSSLAEDSTPGKKQALAG